MDVMLTTGEPEDRRDHFMVIASRDEWEEIMRNVDGVGHSPAMLDLLRGLKRWGL